MDDILHQFSDLCRRYGVRVTHQRLEIYRSLCRTTAHPSAESVFEDVRRHVPTLSLDTVYRTLRTFESAGLAVRVGRIAGRDRFDGDTTPHVHFVCHRCEAVIDLPGEIHAVDDLAKLAPDVGSIHSVYVEARGVCHACSGHGSPTSRS